MVVKQYSTSTSSDNPAFFRGGVSYHNSGNLTISQPGIYYIYAMMEGDPRDGDMRAGFYILLNGSIIITRNFFTRPTTTGTHDDSVIFAGTMRHLQEGDNLAVAISYTSYYQLKKHYCFGTFLIP